MTPDPLQTQIDRAAFAPHGEKRKRERELKHARTEQLIAELEGPQRQLFPAWRRK